MTFCPDCGKAVSSLPEANTNIPLSAVHVSADMPKKKRNKIVIISVGAVIAVVIILVLFNVFGAPPVETISISKTDLVLTEGNALDVDYTVSPEEASDAKLSWSSSDENVATVDKSGQVTAVASGTCEITASARDVSASVQVKVVAPVQNIAFSEETLLLNIGDSKQVSYAITPEEAQDSTLNWSSSDESVATVDQYGKVTAIGGGDCTITASVQDVSASFHVNVVDLAPEETKVIGSWLSTMGTMNGSPIVGIPSYLDLRSDLTGQLQVGDADVSFVWYFYKKDANTLIYRGNTATGDDIGFVYDVEDGEETIVAIISLEEELACLFHRN